MRGRLTIRALAFLLVATAASASIALNSSRSNVYRLTCSGDLASPAQVKTILAELDKLGPADEATLKKWLPANFKRLGIAGDRIKKLIVLPPGKDMKETGIILLTNPGDETAARAVTVKSSKSNSSD
jgi:hypothetical protein